MDSETPEKTSSGQDIQSVLQSLKILEYLAFAGAPMGVTELATALGVGKARVFRHLRTLASAGYVAQDSESEKYGLGNRWALFGPAINKQMNLSSVSKDVMRSLADRFDLTVVVSAVEGTRLTILEIVRANSTVEVVARTGTDLALHSTAQGKLLLAFGDESSREKVLRGPLPESNEFTITDPGVLREQIAVIREQGWAVAPNESLVGINALAAPIFGPQGRLIGTIALLGSIQYVPAKPSIEHVSALVDAAFKISRSLKFDR
ncbi:Transcriptional regulator KdgR [Starkeya nomas]|uniref:Transcriptional regulator KdgR n=1 Tax=Starkeya nomas TaxID=2666134 RepID=A0A5S9PTW8_9HYPH|nr:IclR family transcriptional regulator [Starkeya nomas]CAA0108335.1 Transcriptional regulator KdgR [Starkeya nomas]